MSIQTRQGISFLTSNTLKEAGVVHGFFMRHGGCSPEPWKSLNMATSVGDSRENVIDNRKRLSDCLGIQPDRFYDVWQVHGNTVIDTNGPRTLNEDHIQADAITTDQPDVYLLMLFADCVPVMLHDEKHHAVGIAHAGWKGTLNNVVRELVKRMWKTYGTHTQDLQAVIGPYICREHYQVGKEIAKPAGIAYPDDGVVISEGDHFFFDLGKANETNLLRIGVQKIERMNICTSDQNEDWFSHRGEHGKTGRFAAVIGQPK